MTSIVLITYLIILVIIALSSFNKIKNHTDFFIARKKGSYKSVTGSLLATILGGSAIIGAIDAGNTLGRATTWFMLCAALGLFMLLPLVKKISKLGRFTLPELLEDMHGKKTKIFASFIIPLAWLGIVAAQIIASARILQSFTGMPYETGVIITSIVFTFYTIAGGQISILRTDSLQSILIVAGLTMLAFFTYKNEITTDPLVTILDFPFNINFNPIDLFILVITYATTFMVGPDIYSRIFCAKDHKTARNSIVTTAIILIPIAFLVGYLSIKGAGLNTSETHSATIIDLSIRVLPQWITPLMVIALLSAVLSSADTSMLNSAIIVTGLFEKNGFGKNSLKLTRVMVFIIGGLSLTIALHFTSIIGMLLIALAVYSGAFTLPVISGLIGLKIKPESVSAAIIAGGCVALGGKLWAEYKNDLTGNLIIIASFAINGIILLIGRIKK
jgi:SSS family solute:Na+ symporter